jgi:predicted  nucleic acid-binding Zn-ribbon protein
MLLKATNTKLQAQLESMSLKNSELEGQISKLRVQLKGVESNASRTGGLDQTSKMAEQIEKLLEEKRKLQEMFDEVNEKNKALRHKAG